MNVEHLLTLTILTTILVHEHCHYPLCSALSTFVLVCCTEYVPGPAGCLHRRTAGAGVGVHRTVDGMEVGRRSLHLPVELRTGLVVQGRGPDGGAGWAEPPPKPGNGLADLLCAEPIRKGSYKETI